MHTASFKTNPIALREILQDAGRGELQLPDFQRSWVWDEERIRSLIASVSRGFPIGALMTLETGGDAAFKPRHIEGVSTSAVYHQPRSLLLDGQQRITSLYQVSLRGEVVSTVTAKNKRVDRWFYIDIRKALDPAIDRDEAIIGIPRDKVLRSEFGRQVDLDLSSEEHEYAELMFPVTSIFDADAWIIGHLRNAMKIADESTLEIVEQFKKDVVSNFVDYNVPVIELHRSTSKEAVCVVFEKVNTGGKALDAFELITAMYAADGHELRKDWFGTSEQLGRSERLRQTLVLPGASDGILAKVSNTDFLAVLTLFHTRARHDAAVLEGKAGRDVPQVIANRAALLNLPLSAYLEYEEKAELGFSRAAKFLHTQNIFRTYDLPYQTQLVPLAAILADLDEHWSSDPGASSKVRRWFWSGVFGELYGSTTETRIARDFMEVPAWIAGGGEPSTVIDATFRGDRLWSMRMRLSAAYKGMNALLISERAQDFISGQRYDHTIFLDENVDIHHVFPQDWCQKQGIERGIYNSIVNKTPLSARTNRIIGGVAPSDYLAKIERGSHDRSAVDPAELDESLRTHLIDPELLRSDDFDGFMAARHAAMIHLIEVATGKNVYVGDGSEEGAEAADEEQSEAEYSLPTP